MDYLFILPMVLMMLPMVLIWLPDKEDYSEDISRLEKKLDRIIELLEEEKLNDE